jgi:hypothetical protein
VCFIANEGLRSTNATVRAASMRDQRFHLDEENANRVAYDQARGRYISPTSGAPRSPRYTLVHCSYISVHDPILGVGTVTGSVFVADTHLCVQTHQPLLLYSVVLKWCSWTTGWVTRV